MWKEGTIGIPQKDGGYKAVHYWIKVYEEGSRLLITKLFKKRNIQMNQNKWKSYNTNLKKIYSNYLL